MANPNSSIPSNTRALSSERSRYSMLSWIDTRNSSRLEKRPRCRPGTTIRLLSPWSIRRRRPATQSQHTQSLVSCRLCIVVATITYEILRTCQEVEMFASTFPDDNQGWVQVPTKIRCPSVMLTIQHSRYERSCAWTSSVYPRDFSRSLPESTLRAP